MDRYEVRAALLAAGQSPDAFALEGVHEHQPVPPDFWFLRRSPGGGWEIGSYERGRYEVRMAFGTEAEACAALYTVLTGRPAPT
ncbi:hypothetical protein [Micromonospora auratinigra]|uniref:Uncharacterized protein n=1 Tax=Micromonospora auratinigra TaxID=261654 RepID=A0A1A9A1J9_9ACTN|nr:hypothetical protein [Micromonospora auratinigra]SBT50307.1 hypothetical protein GA0070611_4726 [Micromonospora auratinigra]